MSDIKVLSCGHIYSAATWKEGDTCWFCNQLLNPKKKTSSDQYRCIRGYVLTKDKKSYRTRTLNEIKKDLDNIDVV